MKTAEFGVPCKAPEPGRCRVCGYSGDSVLRNGWADDTKTLCSSPECMKQARVELGLAP